MNERMIRQTVHNTKGVRVIVYDRKNGHEAALEVMGYRDHILMTIEPDHENAGNKCSFSTPYQPCLEEEMDKYPGLGQIIRSLIFRLIDDEVLNDEGKPYVGHYN